MTTMLLMRHGETDAIGKKIIGWQPGWGLNANGRTQVSRLAQRLARLPIRAVYTSPLERAVETAAPVAAAHGLVPVQERDLGEMRFGEWEGLSMQDLDRIPEWKRFNTERSHVRPPGGELMSEVQDRMMRCLRELSARHPDDVVAIVSHGDPLRSVIAEVMDIPLDSLLRFEISPASVSVVKAGAGTSYVLAVNCTEPFV